MWRNAESFNSVAFRQSSGYWYYLDSIHTFIGALLQRCSFSPQRPGWKILPCICSDTVCHSTLLFLSSVLEKDNHNNTEFRAPAELERKSKTSNTLVFTSDSAWLHRELWRATFTTLHLHPYVSIYCMLSPSTQEVIFLITTSYHNDWYPQCCIYQEAGKASVAIRCHQHSQPIQTDFSQHIRLQLHKKHLPPLSSLNTQSIILSVSSLYLLCLLTVHRYQGAVCGSPRKLRNSCSKCGTQAWSRAIYRDRLVQSENGGITSHD